MAEDKALDPEDTVVIDPYFQWAERTNFAYLFAGRFIDRRFPVLIHLREGWTALRFANGEWNPPGKPGEWRQWLRIPPAYASPPPELENSRFCTASVTEQFFRELRTPGTSLRRAVLRVGLGLPFPGQPARNQRPPPAPPRNAGFWRNFLDRIAAICRCIVRWFESLFGLSTITVPAAPRVVIGIIDDGLAFAHHRFRRTDGTTRVEHFWNQDGPLNPPAGFDYGLELVKGGANGIDSWLASCTNAGTVDEDDVYRGTGHLLFGEPGHKPIAWRVAHGTHVMDLACGFDPTDAADQWPIIGVQLPVAATADPSGATLIHRITDGLHYILARARSTPVVVNISYGLSSGPHDGYSELEAVIDEYIQARAGTSAPLAVVLPAGNSRLMRGHARFSLQGPKDQERLYWRVLPDDQTPSHVEIWLPKVAEPGPYPRVKVRVTPPGGPETPWVREGDPPHDVMLNGQFVGRVTYVNAGVEGYHRGMILISLLPTSTHDPAMPVAPSGTWRIRVKKINRDVIDARAWIRRDDTPYGYPRRGRQSYFDDVAYLRLDAAGREIDDDINPPNNSYIKRDGTVNAIATGAQSIVVGSFRRSTWRAAKYSASGPGVHPPGRGGKSPDGPDAMTVSEDSHASHGVLAAGSRSGSCVAMYGTSMAAPQVTRWIANEMAAGGAAGGPYDRDAVFDFAQTGVTPATAPADPRTRTEANPPPWPAVPPAPPAIRGGGGRIEFAPHVDRRIEIDS